ncbi:MAG: hypothetical protein C0627_07850 [Sulfurimonas sp.]|nr:MAG: hypothetical protein C0627_07850 [Sulfurimonas sp.]
MPINRTFPELCETFGKLKQIGKLLKQYNLLNSKYLYLRNNTYYFVLKVKNRVIKKSLKTDNYIYANILKYKIMRYLSMSDLDDLFNNRKTYTLINSKNGLFLSAENEDEEKFLKNIEKTITTQIARESKNNNKIIKVGDEKRDTIKLGSTLKEFLDFKEKTQNEKLLIKYNQVAEYLLIYFGEKQLLQNITRKEANDFRSFLLEVPKFWKNKPELKDKNIKLLVDKKGKLLDKFEKQAPRTVDEIIKRTTTIFEDFKDNLYIHNNPFHNLKKIDGNKAHAISWREFKEKELLSIFKYLESNNFKEEHNYLKFLLMTGTRRGESLSILKEDINLSEGYINVRGTKTENAMRIVPIHDDLFKVLKEQLDCKNEDAFLFFNDKKVTPKYREEKIGTHINSLISMNVKDEIKKELNIHSLRKNFTQELFLSGLFQEIDLKTIVGHSTRGNITDRHYLMGKRDYKKYIQNINQVDFSKYFEEKKEPELKLSF